MTILGVILVIVGGGVAALIFLGLAPAALASLPVPFAGWMVVAVVGVVLILLNRRPGN